MATTTDAELIGTSTAITITLNSLGNSATVGRQSTVVDNTSNLFIELLITVILTTAGSVASPFIASVYLFESEDGSNYDQDDGVIGATDAAYTINANSNLKLIGIISTPTTAKVYNKIMKVSAPLGRKWGIVVINNSGATLSGSGNSASYSGVKYTNA